MIFVNRVSELELLNNKLEQFKNWIWLNTSHLAFLWLRRTWKTYLVKYFLKNVNQKEENIITIFVDISKLTESIRYFCDSILLELAKSYNKSYLDIDLDLFFHEFQNWEFYMFYKDYLKQTDNFKIFDVFLKFITEISKKIKLIIVFDEFQDILNLSKLNWLKNIDSIFRSELQNQENIFYIITGSYPTILRDLIQNPNKKLYSHFDIFDIRNFDKDSSLELINLFNKNLNNKQKVSLYKSCNWNPYLISLILQKVDISLLWDFEKNMRNLLFDKKGAIYNHYEYILEESLWKIQNSTTLKAILKEVSFSEYWLTLTELSKKIWQNPQQISFWLKQLLKIDIIYQNSDKKWKFQDILFSYFISYNLWWIANYEFEKSEYYEEQVKKLQEKLNKTLTELWKTKEFELYYEIKENHWKIWKWIKLPKFKIIQKNYFTQFWDEIDLYAETPAGKKWIFELKYKKKKIWNTEIKKFLDKIEVDKYIFISKSWFSGNILEEYKNNKKLFLIDLSKKY